MDRHRISQMLTYVTCGSMASLFPGNRRISVKGPKSIFSARNFHVRHLPKENFCCSTMNGKLATMLQNIGAINTDGCQEQKFSTFDECEMYCQQQSDFHCKKATLAIHKLTHMMTGAVLLVRKIPIVFVNNQIRHICQHLDRVSKPSE